MRPLRPERRTTNNARIASTSPSAVFAIPDARPDNTARAASIASSSSDLPLRRRSWRLGRSTSITTRPRPRRCRASPAPYAPVPSTPTRSTTPKRASQPCNSRNPVGVVANDSTPNTPPLPSTAAATCTSACVSTPPVTRRVLSTMVIAIPSLSNGQGVARTSREGDRDDQPVRAGRSITLRNGACPIPNPRAHAQAQPERTRHHQHDGGPQTSPPILTGSYGIPVDATEGGNL